MNKETLEKIVFEIVPNNRKTMVKLVIELAETENPNYSIELAQKSKGQLRHELNRLFCYYLKEN